MQRAAVHLPVLLPQILAAIHPRPGAFYIDATFGDGGYSRALLEAAECAVAAIDRDPDAVARAAENMARFADRFEIWEGPFSSLAELAINTRFYRPDAIVFDLGVCSSQLDEAERGFSFRSDGPLDMRMSKQGLSAADIVNQASEKKLADILFHYGEERSARRIARAICKARQNAPLTRTAELAELVRAQLPRAKPGQSDPATRSFQALRIAVNDELGEIKAGLLAAEKLLQPGGVLAVVSFHSLEDRLVKQFITSRTARQAGGSRHRPQAVLPDPSFELAARRPITAEAAESEANPRARSAKLRVVRRTEAAPLSDLPDWKPDWTPDWKEAV